LSKIKVKTKKNQMKPRKTKKNQMKPKKSKKEDLPPTPPIEEKNKKNIYFLSLVKRASARRLGKRCSTSTMIRPASRSTSRPMVSAKWMKRPP